VVASAQVRLQGLVGVADLLDDVLGSLRPEPVIVLDALVDVLTKVVVAVHPDLAGHHGDLRGGGVAGAQSRLQDRRLLGRRQELYLHDQLHTITVPFGLHHEVPAWGTHRPDPHRCEEIMAAVCADFGAELRDFNGEDDHVHLLVHYPPSVAVSKLVNSLKGVSSRYLRQEHGTHLRRYLWGDHLWSPS
jgi:hypothetical protein